MNYNCICQITIALLVFQKAAFASSAEAPGFVPVFALFVFVGVIWTSVIVARSIKDKHKNMGSTVIIALLIAVNIVLLSTLNSWFLPSFITLPILFWIVFVSAEE